jgi:dethiobiotin synthase
MRLVILGTGTNVGKTFVTAALADALRPGRRVLALKPIETGVEVDESGDAGTIASAARHPPALSRWRYRRPVSPHLAAHDQQQEIRAEEVAAWVRQQEDTHKPEVTLVESAGGAFSPLAAGVTNVELASALEPALWLVVAPDALGVLHDVSAVLRALPRQPDAVALSSCRASDSSSGTNATELKRLGICEVLFSLARGSRHVGDVARWLDGCWSLKSGH